MTISAPRSDDSPPPFSDSERRRRRRQLDTLMGKADLDHVVLYGANRSGSAVPWLTGWPVTREALVVHTPNEPDVLLVQFYNHVPQARTLASEADVRWGGASSVDAAADEIRRRAGGRRARVGVIGALPFAAAQVLSAAIGPVVDLSAEYNRLRWAKSSEEVAYLRRAAELTDLSAAAMQRGAGPGTTDYELGALVEGAYLPVGGTNYIHYFAVTSMERPEQCVPSQWPSGRRLRVGDVLSCELSTSYGGDYPGQLLRTFTVAAEPSALVRDLHDVADEALQGIESVLGPGATPEEVVQAAEVIEAAGFTTLDDLVHGLGGGYLPPVLGSRSRTLQPLPDLVFAEGMTVVVQPNVTTPDHRAGVQTGELLHITATGCERLHEFPRGLHRIA
ncbi:MAG: M24 family metallopeptidase [Nocardioidaceae bacterium]